MLFFYLSGYWVSRVWQEKFAETNMLRFYLARYLRIAPLYMLALLACSFLLPYSFQPRSLLIVGAAAHPPAGLNVAWSLDIELQFYLVLPFLYEAITRARTALVILVTATVAAFAWILSKHALPSVLLYLPPFVLGMVTFTTNWRPTERAAMFSLAGFALLSLATCFTPFMSKLTPDPFDRDIYAMVWMLPLLPYVAHSLGRRSNKLDRHIGNISYPFYLLHTACIKLLALHSHLPRTEMRIAALSLSMIASVAVYIFVDRPIDALRVRLTEGTGRREGGV